MKRADVKAGVLYAVKRGEPVMVVDTALWAACSERASDTVYRLARAGEKSYSIGTWGYNSTTIGLPAMRRVSLARWDNALAGRRDDAPDPLRWEWKPTILEPRDALAPLDEHEAARQAEQERQNAEREEHRREADDRLARLAAIADVLSLTNTQRRNLMTPPGYNYNGHVAEVTLEWLEEVAGRLRHSAELEEFATDIGFTLEGDDVPQHLRKRARELMRTRMDVAQGSVSVEVR